MPRRKPSVVTTISLTQHAILHELKVPRIYKIWFGNIQSIVSSSCDIPSDVCYSLTIKSSHHLIHLTVLHCPA
jgi:hypothetical protein